MNQGVLYASLSQAGCKILSFEDYPSNYGSWRVSFMVANIFCEVSCNRGDSLLSLTSKSVVVGNNTIIIPSMKMVSDQHEIAKVTDWIRILKANKSTRQPPADYKQELPYQ